MNRAALTLGLFLFVWPAVTALSMALEAAGSSWPIPARTFLTAAILVPVMVYAVVPALNRALHHRAGPRIAKGSYR